MDRTTFLRSLLGSTALLTVPPLELFPEQQDRLAWSKDCHHLFLYDCFVRGFRHYEGPKLIGHMKDHEDLDLLREYTNEHDPNAVSVYWQGHKLGYLPMGENIALANLIAHGMKLAAYILYTAPELEPWEQCFVGVELLVPASPNFDSYIEDYLDRADAGYKLHQNYGGAVGPEGCAGTSKASQCLSSSLPLKSPLGIPSSVSLRLVN